MFSTVVFQGPWQELWPALTRQLHFCTVFGRWTLPTSGEPPERRQSRQFFGPAPAAQTPEEEQLRCQNPAQGRPKIFSYLDFMPSGELVLLLIISKTIQLLLKILVKSWEAQAFKSRFLIRIWTTFKFYFNDCFLWFSGWVPSVYWGTFTTCQIFCVYMVQFTSGQAEIL